eukprot:CFRG6868T1
MNSILKMLQQSWLMDRRRSLVMVLEDKEGLDAFQEFLCAEFASENLTFWQDLQELKNKNSRAEVREKSSTLLERFFVEESVNLSALKREELVDMLSEIALELSADDFNIRLQRNSGADVLSYNKSDSEQLPSIDTSQANSLHDSRQSLQSIHVDEDEDRCMNVRTGLHHLSQSAVLKKGIHVYPHTTDVHSNMFDSQHRNTQKHTPSNTGVGSETDVDMDDARSIHSSAEDEYTANISNVKGKSESLQVQMQTLAHQFEPVLSRARDDCENEQDDHKNKLEERNVRKSVDVIINTQTKPVSFNPEPKENMCKSTTKKIASAVMQPLDSHEYANSSESIVGGVQHEAPLSPSSHTTLELTSQYESIVPDDQVNGKFPGIEKDVPIVSALSGQEHVMVNGGVPASCMVNAIPSTDTNITYNSNVCASKPHGSRTYQVVDSCVEPGQPLLNQHTESDSVRGDAHRQVDEGSHTSMNAGMSVVADYCVERGEVECPRRSSVNLERRCASCEALTPTRQEIDNPVDTQAEDQMLARNASFELSKDTNRSQDTKKGMYGSPLSSVKTTELMVLAQTQHRGFVDCLVSPLANHVARDIRIANCGQAEARGESESVSVCTTTENMHTSIELSLNSDKTANHIVSTDGNGTAENVFFASGASMVSVNSVINPIRGASEDKRGETSSDLYSCIDPLATGKATGAFMCTTRGQDKKIMNVDSVIDVTGKCRREEINCTLRDQKIISHSMNNIHSSESSNYREEEKYYEDGTKRVSRSGTIITESPTIVPCNKYNRGLPPPVAISDILSDPLHGPPRLHSSVELSNDIVTNPTQHDRPNANTNILSTTPPNKDTKSRWRDNKSHCTANARTSGTFGGAGSQKFLAEGGSERVREDVHPSRCKNKEKAIPDFVIECANEKGAINVRGEFQQDSFGMEDTNTSQKRGRHGRNQYILKYKKSEAIPNFLSESSTGGANDSGSDNTQGSEFLLLRKKSLADNSYKSLLKRSGSMSDVSSIDTLSIASEDQWVALPEFLLSEENVQARQFVDHSNFKRRPRQSLAQKQMRVVKHKSLHSFLGVATDPQLSMGTNMVGKKSVGLSALLDSISALNLKPLRNMYDGTSSHSPSNSAAFVGTRNVNHSIPADINKGIFPRQSSRTGFEDKKKLDNSEMQRRHHSVEGETPENDEDLKPGTQSHNGSFHEKMGYVISKKEKNVLDSAQCSVLTLMATDSFPRFLNNHVGEAYIQSLFLRPPTPDISDHYDNLEQIILSKLGSRQSWFAQFCKLAFMMPFGVSICARVKKADEKAEGRFPIAFVNSQWTNITGYTCQESVGRNVEFLNGKNTEKKLSELHADAMEHGKSLQTTMISYKKGGIPFTDHLYLYPVFDKKGTLRFFIRISFDATGMDASMIKALGPVRQFLISQEVAM